MVDCLQSIAGAIPVISSQGSFVIAITIMIFNNKEGSAYLGKAQK